MPVQRREPFREIGSRFNSISEKSSREEDTINHYFDQKQAQLTQSDIGDISDEMISIEDTYKEMGSKKYASTSEEDAL